jgi:hypothetical protein
MKSSNFSTPRALRCLLVFTTAKILNALLVLPLLLIITVSGTVWQSETLDSLIRSTAHLLTGTQTQTEGVVIYWDWRGRDLFFATAQTSAALGQTTAGWQEISGVVHYGYSNEHPGMLKVPQLEVFSPFLDGQSATKEAKAPTHRFGHSKNQLMRDPSAWLAALMADIPIGVLSVNNGSVRWRGSNDLLIVAVRDINITGDQNPTGLFGTINGVVLTQNLELPLELKISGDAALDGRIRIIRLDGVAATSGAAPMVGDGKLTAEFDLDARRLRLDESTLRVGAAGTLRLVAGGAWDSRSNAFALSTQLTLDTLSHAELAVLWPEGLAPNPRAWVMANLRDGMVRDLKSTANIGVIMTAKGAEVSLRDVSGSMSLTGFTVTYFGALPAVRDVSGEAVFDHNSFRIKLLSGQCNGVKLISGQVDLLGLDDDVQNADIKVNLSGGVRNQLQIVNAEPLRYADFFKLPLTSVDGMATTEFTTLLPLINDIPIDKLRITVNSVLRDAVFAVPGTAFSLAQLNGSLKVTETGLVLNGKGLLNTIPADVAWTMDFTGTSSNRETARVRVADLLPEQLNRQFAIDIRPYVNGLILATVDYLAPRSGATVVKVSADLNRAAVKLPYVLWDKPANAPLKLDGDVLISPGKTELRSFALTADNTDVKGSGLLRGDTLVKLDFKTLKLGDSAGILAISTEGGLRTVTGDFSKLSLRLLSDNPAPQPIPTDKPVQPDKSSFLVNIKAMAVRGVESAGAFRVALNWRRDQGSTTLFDLSGNSLLDNGRAVPFRAVLNSPRNAPPVISMTAEDAGSFLRAFGLYPHIRGGSLTATVRLAPPVDIGRPAEIDIAIKDFGLWRAPLLGRILSVASITGPLALLAGEGLPFSTLETKMRLTNTTLTIDEAKLLGSSLGVLASGTLNRADDTIALEGAIMPAYIITQIIGGIPVLGDLLTRGNQEGIIAVRYSASGTLDDPSVSVNPLTALTPGFLRGVFDIFKTTPPAQ